MQSQFIDKIFAVPVVVQRQIPVAISCCFPEMAALVADVGSGMVMAGFCWLYAVRTVSPLVVIRPKVLGILFGVDVQQTVMTPQVQPSLTTAVFFSWLVCCFDALRAVF